MRPGIYRYKFSADLNFTEAEDSLLLAALAAEGLHGRSQVRLDASFCTSREKGSCVIDARTEVGRSIAKIFTGFLTREFGDEAFQVERIEPESEPRQVPMTAEAAP